MILNKFEIILALLAALIVTVAGIIVQMPAGVLARDILLTLAAFYLIGLAMKHFVLKRVLGEKENSDGSNKDNENGGDEKDVNEAKSEESVSGNTEMPE